MNLSVSLRMRLTVIILLPILAVATIAGIWQLNNARRTAADVFDRSLLSAALAVSNDVAISGGDALSPEVNAILSDTSGGRVFYHVYGPDGVIIAGYATPPVGIPAPQSELGKPTVFDATYQGRPVSGVRLRTRTQIDGFAGIFTTTVWQDRAVRVAFVRDLVMRSMITITGLIASLALIVWFGVRLGLRPLLDLEQAIARRSSDELSPIARAVPGEVAGIVRVLNRLFEQVSRSMTAQAEFISNAAHQLRNPIAGVLSLAEVVHATKDPAKAQERAADLLDAARETAELSQKLLLLERAKTMTPGSARREIDLSVVLEGWVASMRAVMRPGVTLELEIGKGVGPLTCDPTMLQEALRNLVENACQHGGPELSRITLSARATPGEIILSVEDNGVGIAAQDLDAARERFRQLAPSSSSGLGLSIVDTIVAGHDGEMRLKPQAQGLKVELHLKL